MNTDNMSYQARERSTHASENNLAHIVLTYYEKFYSKLSSNQREVPKIETVFTFPSSEEDVAREMLA